MTMVARGRSPAAATLEIRPGERAPLRGRDFRTYQRSMRLDNGEREVTPPPKRTSQGTSPRTMTENEAVRYSELIARDEAPECPPEERVTSLHSKYGCHPAYTLFCIERWGISSMEAWWLRHRTKNAIIDFLSGIEWAQRWTNSTITDWVGQAERLRKVWEDLNCEKQEEAFLRGKAKVRVEIALSSEETLRLQSKVLRRCEPDEAREWKRPADNLVSRIIRQIKMRILEPPIVEETLTASEAENETFRAAKSNLDEAQAWMERLDLVRNAIELASMVSQCPAADDGLGPGDFDWVLRDHCWLARARVRNAFEALKDGYREIAPELRFKWIQQTYEVLLSRAAQVFNSERADTFAEALELAKVEVLGHEHKGAPQRGRVDLRPCALRQDQKQEKAPVGSRKRNPQVKGRARRTDRSKMWVQSRRDKGPRIQRRGHVACKRTRDTVRRPKGHPRS